MTLGPLIFEPLFDLWTAVVLLAPPAALLIWQLWRTWRPGKAGKASGVAGGWKSRVSPLRRLLIVALLAFAAAGPGDPRSHDQGGGVRHRRVPRHRHDHELERRGLRRRVDPPRRDQG